MMRIVLFFILSIVLGASHSQGVFFNRSYLAPETYWTWGKSVVKTDNGYLACAIGSGYNGWTNKNVILCFTDVEGTPYEWKHYGETAYHYYPAGNGSLVHIEGTGYALPVVLEQGDCHPSRLFMFDYSGDTIWTRRFIDEESGDSCVLLFRNLIQGYNNDLIICGAQYGTAGENGNFLLIRTTSQGIKKWQKTFGTSATEELCSMAETPDNGLILGGFSYNVGVDFTGDPVVIKIDYWGNVEWQKTFGGDLKDASAKVAIAHDNNYIIGYGHAYFEPIPGYAHRVLVFLKVNQSGDTIWHRQIGDTLLGNSVDKIIPLDDGNYMAMGTTQIEPNVFSRSFLYKFNDNGDSLWYKQYLHHPNVPTNQFSDFRQTEDGGFILCGGINTETPPNPQQMWMMTVDSNGCDTCGTGVAISELTNVHNDAFVIFPNPASSEIHCRLSVCRNFNEGGLVVDCLSAGASAKAGRFSMFIYDMYGKTQEKIQIPKGQEQLRIDVSNYPAGIYIAVLKNEKRILGRRKFVVR